VNKLSKYKVKKFTLIDNARDSLNHAVDHLTKEKLLLGDLKCALRDVSHVVELLIKERLYRVHPAFVWQNVDKYPRDEENTVGVQQAVERLSKIAGLILKSDEIMVINRCKKIRNEIEHYEFILDEKEVKVIIGKVLSFIISFSIKHLSVDFENEFKSDDRWKTLLDLYEFWEAHSKSVRDDLESKNIPYCECPSCYADTFNLAIDQCALCGHIEQEVECEKCGDSVWESNSETLEFEDGDFDSGRSFSANLTSKAT